MTAPLVEMRDMVKSFGGIKAVDHVTIDLYPGEVVGVLGHNGAGKSVLMKMLSGACSATAARSTSTARRPRSTIRATRATTRSRPSTSISRSPTIWTRPRTCFLGAN
jgi:ABC-type sugar transport system ATPase subunit